MYAGQAASNWNAVKIQLSIVLVLLVQLSKILKGDYESSLPFIIYILNTNTYESKNYSNRRK